jgi:hypothetical protein
MSASWTDPNQDAVNSFNQSKSLMDDTHARYGYNFADYPDDVKQQWVDAGLVTDPNRAGGTDTPAAVPAAATPATSPAAANAATTTTGATTTAATTAPNPPPGNGTQLMGLPAMTPQPTSGNTSTTPAPVQSQSDSRPSAAGTMILCARGTTLSVPVTDTYASGFCAIEEWSRYPADAYNPQVDDENTAFNLQAQLMPVLFTGMRIGERDIFGATACLDNIKVFYTYGQNFGDVTIAGEILLGNQGDRPASDFTVKTMADFFWKYRVSNRKLPVTVSLLSEKYLVYLVGMEFGEIIADVHILPFVLRGVLLDISRNPGALVNPPSVMLSTLDVNNSSVIAALNSRKGVIASLTNPQARQDVTAADGTNASTSVPSQQPPTDADGFVHTKPSNKAAPITIYNNFQAAVAGRYGSTTIDGKVTPNYTSSDPLIAQWAANRNTMANLDPNSQQYKDLQSQNAKLENTFTAKANAEANAAYNLNVESNGSVQVVTIKDSSYIPYAQPAMGGEVLNPKGGAVDVLNNPPPQNASVSSSSAPTGSSFSAQLPATSSVAGAIAKVL